MLVKVADISWSKRMAKGFEPPVVRPMEVREAKIINRSVLQHFQQIKDLRVDRTKRHILMAIITIAILAVLVGADGFVAIETYGKAKQIAARWRSF